LFPRVRGIALCVELVLVPAERAGAMAGGERRRLVQEEQLGEAAGLKQGPPLPATELEPAGDPALAVVASADATGLIVKAAAVAVDQPTAGVRNQLAERCNAVLERHLGQPSVLFWWLSSSSMVESRRGGEPVTTTTVYKHEIDTLVELNRDYIRSVQHGDVRRFDEILADDFLCSNPDGSVSDRASFLEQTAKPVTIANLEAHDVDVRLMGDFAIIHARTTYTQPDGQAGAGRYTDVWARRDGRWLPVSAHVTRC
jgi:ketosteroid isomerase-like protein